MQSYEYKVVPAPQKGEKSRKARSTPERFALALTTLMNSEAADGWEYLRADTLPCEERVGLTGKATHFQHMLVFRRALQVAMPQAHLGHDAAPPGPPPAPAPTLVEAAAMLPDDAPTVIAPLAAPDPAPSRPAAAPLLFPGPRPNGRA